ncbi:hypothetical protein D3C73_1131430 [compost metagenome]
MEMSGLQQQHVTMMQFIRDFIFLNIENAVINQKQHVFRRLTGKVHPVIRKNIPLHKGCLRKLVG